MPYSKRQLQRILAPDLVPADDVPNTAERVAETVVRAQTRAVEERSIRQLYALYAAAYTALRNYAVARAERRGLTTGEQTPNAYAWRDEVVSEAERLVVTLTDDVAAEALRGTVSAYSGGMVGRLWLLDMATRADVNIQRPAANAVSSYLTSLLQGLPAGGRGGLPPVLVPVGRDGYNDLIRSLMGREWRQQYADQLDDVVLTIRRAIGQGLVDGDGVSAIMRRVADNMGVVTDRRRGTAGSAARQTYRANFNRVQTIVRTVINQASSNGALSAYRANADILQGYEWLTARDERVCAQCRGLNGTVYKFSDLIRPPAHPNCRCTVIPVILAKVLTPDFEPPRETFGDWARGYGMERELADFLVGAA